MKNQKAILTNELHTIHFEFENLFNEEAIFIYYSYNDSDTKFRGRSRKINKDSKGLYFIHNRQKVRIEEAQ